MRSTRGKTGAESGFTMVELLVAVSLSVLLVTVVTMAFQVSANTIKTVQRKLDIYEAARGHMHNFALAFKPAGLTLAGDHFIIKSCAWQDDDPDTPAMLPAEQTGAQLFARSTAPDATKPMDTIKYERSRREADFLGFTQSTLVGDSKGSDIPYAGQTPGSLGFKSERFSHSLLSVQTDDNMTLDPPFADGILNVQRMYIEAHGKYFIPVRSDQHDASWNYFHRYSQLEEFEWRPGREFGGVSEGYDRYRGVERYRADVYAMDFNVSFWHDRVRKYIDPPDFTMIAIAPIPSSIKCTVTVWDFDGKDYETFSRLIWLPAGVGGVRVTNGAIDLTHEYVGPGTQPWVPPIDPNDPATPVTYSNCDDDWTDAGAKIPSPRSAYFNRYKQIVGNTAGGYRFACDWKLLNNENDPPPW